MSDGLSFVINQYYDHSLDLSAWEKKNQYNVYSLPCLKFVIDVSKALLHGSRHRKTGGEI